MSENFDLGAAIEAESGNNTEATTTSNDTSKSGIPYEMNEGTEGYYLFGNSSSLSDAASKKAFGNEGFYKVFDTEDVNENSWFDVDLSDYKGLVEGANDPSKQEKLALIHALAKSNFGDIQGMKNSGYGMGWDTDGEGPPTIYDNEKVDHTPYFDVYPNFEAFEMETLSDGEIEMLESNGLDMDNYGPMESHEGPALPVINGERVPVIAETNDDVVKALELLNTIDFSEVTYCEKHGELQGTPTLGPSESTDSEKEEEGDSSDEVYPENIDLAEDPEAVSDLIIAEIEPKVEEIQNKRTLKTMLRAEEESKDRKGAKGAIEVQLESIDGDNDSEATEDTEDSDDSDDIEWTEADISVMNTLVETGRAEDREDAKEQLLSL